jgi:small subunit ribosomal protein S8
MTTLSNMMVAVRNAAKAGKSEALIRPTSSLCTAVLQLMQKNGYIGEFETIDDNRGKVYKLKLPHTINECGAISPRTPVRVFEIEKWEKRYLPAQGFGVLMLSTSAGIVSHEEAKKKKIGGKLIAFVY